MLHWSLLSFAIERCRPCSHFFLFHSIHSGCFYFYNGKIKCRYFTPTSCCWLSFFEFFKFVAFQPTDCMIFVQKVLTFCLENFHFGCVSPCNYVAKYLSFSLLNCYYHFVKVCFPLLIFRSEMFPSRGRYHLTKIL